MGRKTYGGAGATGKYITGTVITGMPSIKETR